MGGCDSLLTFHLDLGSRRPLAPTPSLSLERPLCPPFPEGELFARTQARGSCVVWRPPRWYTWLNLLLSWPLKPHTCKSPWWLNLPRAGGPPHPRLSRPSLSRGELLNRQCRRIQALIT